MMPMRPAARANRLIRLIARLDGHIGHQALVLPAREVFGGDGLDHALAFQIGFRRRGEERLLPRSIERFPGGPLDGVESLLKDVIRARLEVAILPSAEPSCGIPVGILLIAA